MLVRRGRAESGVYLVSLDRRPLAIFRAALGCALRPENSHAQIPDFVIQSRESSF